MAVKIVIENGRISNFEGLVTLTLNRVILHTIEHQSSTSTYTLNVIEIEETFCGGMDVHTDGQTVPSSKSCNTKTKEPTGGWPIHPILGFWGSKVPQNGIFPTQDADEPPCKM